MASWPPASPSSRPSSLRAAALGLLLAAWPHAASASFEVAGEVLATEPQLVVRVTVTNRGAQRTGPLEVSGEWPTGRALGRLPAGLQPGGSGSVVLSFALGEVEPGVHGLPLLIEHPLDGARDAGGNAPVASERAWLLVALGDSPPADVKLAPAPARLTVRGSLAVVLTSLDREPHRVRLKVLTARGLRVEGGPRDVAVPGTGEARVEVPLMRAGAPRGSVHGLLVLSESLDGPPHRTAVAVAQVQVEAVGGLVPRYRGWLIAVAVALLGVVLGVEAWRTLRRTDSA